MLKEIRGKTHYSLCHSKISKWFFMLPQIMVRREVFDRAGLFDPDFKYAEDIEFVYRLSRNTRFTGTAEPLIIYYDIPFSFSKNSQKMSEYSELFIYRYSETMPALEKSRWLYSIGKQHICSGTPVTGYILFLKAFKTFPFNERAARKIIRHFPLFLFHLLKRKNEI